MFRSFYQSGNDRTLNDLAKSARSDLRYLKPRIKIRCRQKITAVRLHRSHHDQGAPPDSWDNMAIDIDENRKKTLLCLVWKTVQVDTQGEYLRPFIPPSH